MGEWLLVNLFLLAIILIGAALSFVGGSIFQWLDPSPGPFAVWSAALVAAIGLVLLYYISKALHGYIERRVNRPRKTG